MGSTPQARDSPGAGREGSARATAGAASPEPQGRIAPTRARILGAAIELLRERGFTATTMRDIARRAGMSLGAAYYHFASKEALVLAYYRELHEERLRHGQVLLARTTDLRERTLGLLHHHIDAFAGDQPLLAALVRIVADPTSEASVFGSGTRDIREADIALFRQALDAPNTLALPPGHLDIGALALWALQLGLLLYLAWDGSPQGARTHRLAEQAVDLLLPLAPLLTTPLAAPLLDRLRAVLREAGLVATAEGGGQAAGRDEQGPR